MNEALRNRIVFVADIEQDIDDMIAIEYLHNSGYLKCVVLDGKSEDTDRIKELKALGVVFETYIPKGTSIVCCGGALNKVDEYIKDNELLLLVANGGFAGNNIVDPIDTLKKFKNKRTVRTYNFNLDVDAALSVLSSKNIKDILLVSKNVCHSPLNCIGKIHKDSFLDKYNLNEKKRLHDLLMVKECISITSNEVIRCEYKKIAPIFERKFPNNMSTWGSKLNKYSHISISTKFRDL